jgi:hypothetical protein
MSVQPIRPLELMKDSSITKSEFSDFIGVWEGLVPPVLCESIINHFDDIVINCSTLKQQDIDYMDGEKQFSNGKLGRSDQSVLLNQTSQPLSSNLNQYLQSTAAHYVDRYPQLKSCKLISTDLKVQKTSPEGGYHEWHYENSGYDFCNRELVWILYLNTMPEGEAETEFMYQKRRINPTQGTVVIWPAGMTHVHKGNTVFTKDKYIVTGWYLKIP